MGNFRFLILSAAVFAAAFAGMSWAARSRAAISSSPPAPHAHAPQTLPATPAPLAALAPQVQEEAPPYARAPSPGDAAPRLPTRPEPVPEPTPAAAEPVRPKPAPSPPGDGTSQIRATAIQTAMAYAVSPCNPAARAAFVVAASSYIRTETRSADHQVRDAIHAAFGAGGITGDDFPASARAWVSEMPVAARASCGGARQTANRSR